MVGQLSVSTEKYNLQKERYINGQRKRNKDLSRPYLKMLSRLKKIDANKFGDLESKKNNLEYDLRTTDWILEKVRASNGYAQNLYAAMCNNDFIKNEPWIILKNETWSCSWRYAGGIIADMQGRGDYMNWYCSGIRDNEISDEVFQQMTKDAREHFIYVRDNYVSESVVTDQIRADLLTLSWIVIDDDNQKSF